jgi:hypothetical protein
MSEDTGPVFPSALTLYSLRIKRFYRGVTAYPIVNAMAGNINKGEAAMGRRFMVCMFALVAFSASAAHGHGHGQSVAGADGGNGSDGGVAIILGRAGCPGGTDPDKHGHFYLPGTREPCNPGPQDAEKVGSSR